LITPTPEETPRETWTLIRRARQLLTLHGPSGPRRGSAHKELGAIRDGALLLRNGIIQEVGTSRRVENLAQSRRAREIDAAGRLVMPAFLDPDAVLLYPRPAGLNSPENAAPTRLRVLAKHRLFASATAAARDWVRAGVLSVGSHTAYAEDLRDTVRILRAHQSLQARPLRIRSIFAPRVQDSARALIDNLTTKWLDSVRKRKLATIVELLLEPDGLTPAQLREVAVAATTLGYAVRLRGTWRESWELLNLSLATGAVALLAPPLPPCDRLRALADLGSVHILPLSSSLQDPAVHNKAWPGATVRAELDAGIPVALASGFNPGGVTTMNPQYLLYLATRHGMEPAEAIVAATYNAACSLRLSHVTGSLEPGKSADLLMLDVPDYRDLFRRVGHNDVLLAVKSGVPVYKRAGLMAD